MARTATVRSIDAHYSQGRLDLVEPLPLADGMFVRVLVTLPAEQPAGEGGLDASSGGWADLVDCDAFERELHERRHRQRQRQPVDL